MKLGSILIAAVLLGALTGCNLKQNYARNNLAADQCLQANVGQAGVNVQGAWEA
jgi:hypothetical protein